MPRGRARRLADSVRMAEARSRYTNFRGSDYQIRGMDMMRSVCEYCVAG
jgi:hypothetical protein